MKLNLRHIILTFALPAAVALTSTQASADVKALVTVGNITSSTPLNDAHKPQNLLNTDPNQKFHTPDDEKDKSLGGEQYLQVNLDNDLQLAADEDLIVYVRRCNTCVVRQPTAFRVEGQMAGASDNDTWEEICNIYFLYRGQYTKEYSARFHPKKAYRKLRFVVTQNNSRNFDIDGHRSMGLSEFQVYQVKRGEFPNDKMSDPWHLKDDYKYDYHDYKFVHTMGWLDEANRDLGKTTENKPGFFDDKINNEANTKGELKAQQDYINNIRGWASWDKVWGSDGKWQLDTVKLKEIGVAMPDMGLITKDADFNATISSNAPSRQATHETEHILYAVPGDPIILYPYYKFADPKHYEKYEVNFAHWYDYRTGGRIEYSDDCGNKADLLDFIADPSNVCITDTNGFYGAYLLTEKPGNNPKRNSQNYGMFATFFCPRNPLDDKGSVRELPFRDIDKASGMNDVDEYVIAADFSQSFNKGRNIVGNQIIEPNIAFRHIFRIRDGKKFADELSGSKQANKDYIAKTSRQVMARAGQEFQIGLDGGVPKPIKEYFAGSNESWWRSVPSKYYYKVSDDDYRRIRSMAIRVTDPNGNVTVYSHTGGAEKYWQPGEDNEPCNPDHLFYFDTEEFSVGGEKDVPMFTGLGSREIDGVFYGVGGSVIKRDDDIKYCRLLKTKKALSGRYKVEILGEEIVGEGHPRFIKLYDGSSDDAHNQTSSAGYTGTEDDILVVMEYVIDFVNNEDHETDPQALLVTGKRLYEDETLAFAREEELIKKYGEPKDKIDFDYYRELEKLDNKKEYLDETVVDEDNKYYRYKWPASWEKSNYGFGYSENHNYNMYVVANHSSKTPWHNRWHDNDKHDDKETVGIFDVLEWKTNPENGVVTQAAPATRVEEKVNNHGYFLYVNAANDPGVMVTLNAGTLCNGSTINVSAWVAEFSKQDESANIIFNLVAVLKETGERINVHSYVSGYLPNHEEAGQWMKIFYSFQPDVDRIGYSSSEIDHYEIELENNCKSSDGADYAIDEISIYIVTPVIGAEQETPVCLDTDVNDQTVKIYAPFSETLHSINMTEAAGENGRKDVRFDYVIVDKAKFDAAYKEAKDNPEITDPGATAYEEVGVVKKGTVDFSSCFSENPAYSTRIGMNTAGGYRDERNTKMIAFKVNFGDENFAIDKEYYIGLYAQTVNADGSVGVADVGWMQYDFTDPCSKAYTFKVASKNNVRIDGEIRAQDGDIEICEGESPEISIDVKRAGEDDAVYNEGALCDWYKGTKAEFDDEKDESGLTLYKAMTYFRDAYPEVEGPEDESVIVIENFFTQSMIDLIKANKEKILFKADKYKFAPLESGDEEVVVTAMPIPFVEEGDESDQPICTSPKEIKIKVVAKTPTVLHGIAGVDYPDDLEDVPLRVGLDQLGTVSVNEDDEIAADQNMLVIPLHKVEASGVVKNVETLKTTAATELTLEFTTDPAEDYKAETVTASSGERYEVKPEIVAGEVRRFTAGVKEGSKNELAVVFYNSFAFREGYEYTFSYHFEEEMPEGENHICKGKDLFTVKVVPEYLVWTPGEDSRSWNNDGNWRRVSSETLKADLTDTDVKDRLNDKVTDGETNDNVSAYVPMNFTKVIIPGSETTAPYLYECKDNENDVVTLDDNDEATADIEYDMVANATATGLDCGFWSGNTCNQIHFLPTATLMNQHWLTYSKAWVDLEIDPQRWYTLAMPLKRVFAGEFYLPTDGARQATELFQEIKYDPEKNDRFNPAVFQRGWDKGTALTYLAEGGTSSAVVKANWSHVYNDVEESYGSGVGFSIKTDLSRMAAAEKPEKVVFRLPKADETYDYYDSEGKVKNEGNKKTITHGNDHYKLNATNGTITATTAGNEYFLVGNPFMTYLDMTKFLKENDGKIEQKYWMITSGSQKMGVFDPESEGFVGSASGVVAPMQGFFVKTLETVGQISKLELAYDETMMSDVPASPAESPIRSITRSFDEGFTLSISALNEGRESTSAVLGVSAEAADGYKAEEDMVVIDNSDLEVKATVYTVGDGKALAINRMENVGRVELGVIALPEEETELRFDLDNEESGLMLYDAQTGAYTTIYDGMTYAVSGNVAGRLFLTASKDSEDAIEQRISWSSMGEEVTVRSAEESDNGLNVKVYDYSGRCVVAQSSEGSELRFRLSPGVYVLEAATDSERLCVQIKI